MILFPGKSQQVPGGQRSEAMAYRECPATHVYPKYSFRNNIYDSNKMSCCYFRGHNVVQNDKWKVYCIG